MRNHATSLLAILLSAACVDPTPPLRHPVTHDITLTTTSTWTDPVSGSKPIPTNSVALRTLDVDFGTNGASFDTSPCYGVTQGRLSAGGGFMNASFKGEDDGPVMTMTGQRDSLGVMTGTFECQSWTRSPHYILNSGTFVATPRK